MEIVSMAKKDKEATEPAATEPAATEEATAQPAPTGTQEGLQLSDLQIMMQIIDVCTQRGAIKADEMATVGAVYSKLKMFVAQTTQAAPSTDQGPVDSEGGQPD